MSQPQETSFDFEIDYYDLGSAVAGQFFLPEPHSWGQDDSGSDVAEMFLNGLRDRRQEGITASSRLERLQELKSIGKPFYGSTATAIYELLNEAHSREPSIENFNNLSLFVNGCSSSLEGEIRLLRALEQIDIETWNEEASEIVESLAQGSLSAFKTLLDASKLVCTSDQRRCFALGSGFTLVQDDESLEIYSEMLMALGHMGYSTDDDECIHFLDQSCAEFHEHDIGITLNATRANAHPYLRYLELS